MRTPLRACRPRHPRRVSVPMRQQRAGVRRSTEPGQAGIERVTVDLVGDPSEDVRGAVVRALEGVEGGDAEAALERLAPDPVVTVRDRAAAILATRRHGP